MSSLERAQLEAAYLLLDAKMQRMPFHAGETLRFGNTVVHSIPTPHDGVDGVAYVVESEGRRNPTVSVLSPFQFPANTMSAGSPQKNEASAMPVVSVFR